MWGVGFSRLFTLSISMLVLVGMGFLLQPIRPETAVVSGGFRSLAGGVAWLRAYVAWEKQEEAETLAWLEVATKLSPESLSFWINGARMIAHDLPYWDSGYASRSEPNPVRVSACARRALALLARATEYHPDHAALWIERANIELHRLRDVEAAAESYRRAALAPNPPDYAARVHAELLRRLGRNPEALAWLREILPTLSGAEKSDVRDELLSRIAAIEREIGEDASERPKRL